MKPKLLKVPLQPQHSFNIRFNKLPNFFTEFHFHPEIEMVYIHQGKGSQLIGNTLLQFKEGDLVLIGADVPHLWRCDDAATIATVLHFPPDLFGHTFMQLPENRALQKLLIKAKAGLKILRKTNQQTSTILQQMLEAPAANRLILLLQLLHLLAPSKDILTINTKDQTPDFTDKTSDRMNAVLTYLFNHFSQPITLEAIAQVANMSTNAFCRYFKKSTQKTVSHFLLELRINHACKLLSETNKSISDICYESGFNNLSNFNRYFKMQMHQTPMQFRKQA